MRLALIIDDYLPHSTRIGAKMFHELALELQSLGHNITVITPAENQQYSLYVDNLDGITVWRFKNGPIKNVKRISRAINETLLSYNAWKAIKHLVNKDSFDGIIYYSPSIFWGKLVNNLKKKCQCPSYLILRDLFPQWVVDAGMLKSGSLIEKYFRFFEQYSYKQASIIGLMSKKNLDFFYTHKNNKYYKCEVLRNWANTSEIPIKKEGYTSIRTSLNLQNKTIFFYGGNIGHAQDMENLMRLVKKMSIYPDAHFLFIGQGDEVDLINSLANKWNLSNFSYLPSVNQNEFKLILKEIDIGLFSLAAHHSAHNFPGKLLGYMANNIPILGSVNVGNDLLDLINHENAGFVHINGEDDDLFESAKKLYLDITLRKKCGHDAYKLLCKEFAVTSIASTLIDRLRLLK
ncbi:glycosyltransferase family 4 protein [Proteus mirabilis]|uniref:glycosyltransferase family 4 protein n=1 Tax=Proteus mirabilis TaxID=584 RepID=UPI0018C4E535|nr:glycosyltransferase family 4 protein [Proteus mirabilis]MBJ5789590.1 glycosyltransferase family 4 protein [Salmonella enterica subsp. enterica serovar Agona]ELA9905163.1 glycosyltransferase family 4 protein [Proteus mirabilis]MBG2799133.1 glycosyltransferase family 4 protein [Proteus mirabilis]MBG6045093.1 glycosyltransferase family 4 protein [Proteus mirabilis]MBI6412390.1 glycosyltransferase family 4 protein [Proteus mirabilis]